ncbi:MAG TPA: CpsB/CapC family capsule biosynthesis tyrosine phosphatase [Gemmatimonadaceae bacterium]|nr:CpsB/CapC family capsule biosynthesis tyrosine phosphatase [Gemmatimonadaceae bacterium]
MIDIHTHLLPAVDDGSRSIEASVAVLARFARDGVERVVCTPHLRASEAAAAPYARHQALLAELAAAAPAVPALALGWEIMLDTPGADLTAPELALDGAAAVLVEFGRAAVPTAADGELRRIRDAGRIPVVAHPDRYFGCTADQVRRWRDGGAAIQMDANMLLADVPQSRLARELLESGLADCMASDNHGDDRSLGAVRRWLEEADAPEQARLLTHVNPGRLLRGEPPLPVAPVPRAGAFERLRRLVFGRA